MLRLSIPLLVGCAGTGGVIENRLPSTEAEAVGERADTRTANAGDGIEGPTDLPAALRGIVAAHNAKRARHCAPKLVWSSKLAAIAQRWATHLAEAGCAFEHSRGDYGENLAAGTDGAFDPETIVAMWYDEVEQYDFAQPGFAMTTGHFTQLVWRGSRRLGCGTAVCKGVRTWVCNYDPPGNYEGQYRENVLPSSCAAHR